MTAELRLLLTASGRRSRVFLAVWAYVLLAVSVGTVASFRSLYPTGQARAALANGVRETVALLALSGRISGSSLGELVQWRLMSLGGIALGVFNVLLVVRHTRAEEESGQAELVLSRGLSRTLPLTIALILALSVDLLVGVVMAIGFPVLGLAAGPSVGFGLTWFLLGAAFAGVAALAAQIAETTRGANTLGLAVVLVGFVLRALGDASPGLSFLAWWSPLGWAERTDWYAGNRWFPLLLLAALAFVAIVTAGRRSRTRDLGAGLFPSRPGPAGAGRTLSGPLGLVWRLQRGQLVGWTIALGALLAFAGASAPGIGEIFGGSGSSRDLLVRMGGNGQLEIAFLAIMIQVAGLFAAVVAVSAVAGMAKEERAGRSEPVVAGISGRQGRIHLLAAHLAVAVVGVLMMLAVAGVVSGLAADLAAPADHRPVLGETVLGALAQLPAVLVLLAVAVLFVCSSPRWAPGGWSVLGAVFLLSELGPSLDLPHWIAEVAPFAHMAAVGSGQWLTVASGGIGAGALVAIGVSFLLFRHRDLG